MLKDDSSDDLLTMRTSEYEASPWQSRARTAIKVAFLATPNVSPAQNSQARSTRSIKHYKRFCHDQRRDFVAAFAMCKVTVQRLQQLPLCA